MSTILDALKRVEEQIRIEAEQRAAEGVSAQSDLSKFRKDAPGQAINGSAGDGDEVAEVYSAILRMLAGIQDQIRTQKDEWRAEARGANADLAKAVAALQNDLIRQRDAVQKEFQKRDNEHTAGNAKLAEAQSQSDALKKALAEAKVAHADLAKAVTASQNELVRQREAIQKEFQKRDADRAAGNAKLTETQSHADALKKSLSETRAAYAELAKAVTSLQSEFIFQRDAVQKDFQKRDTDRAAGNARLAESQSQTETLKKTLTETKTACAELSKALAALQNDFTCRLDSVQKEIQKRDAERAAVSARQTDTQSQTDALKKMHAETKTACAELAKAVTLLQNDAVRQRDAVQKEFQKRDTEHAAGAAKAAESQSQIDALRKSLAEFKAAYTDLARVLKGLQGEFVLQRDVMQKGFLKRDAEIEAAKARLVESLAQNGALTKTLTETRGNHAELAQTMAVLRRDFACQMEAVYKEFQQRNADRETADKRLSDALSQNDALRHMLDDVRGSQNELAHTAQVLRQEFTRQSEALQQEITRRGADWEATAARLAQALAQNSAPQQAPAAAGLDHAELTAITEALRRDFARQVGALQQEIAKRDADWETATAKISKALAQSAPSPQAPAQVQMDPAVLTKTTDALRRDFALQIEALRKEFEARQASLAVVVQPEEPSSQSDAVQAQLDETRATHAALEQTVAALKNELAHQREAFQEESRKRDAGRAADAAVLAALQAQADSLRQLVGNCECAIADMMANVPLAAAAEPVTGGAEPKPQMDKDEVLRLHKAAREAYVKKDFSGTLRILDLIDAAFPNNKGVLYNRAECLIALGRSAEARDLCDHMISNLNHAPAAELKRLIRD